jgi:3-oxoacyl-[acyl-carrier-protein] synthase-3
MKKGANNKMEERFALSNTASNRDVYVAGIGHFLPGDPIPVDSIDEILGEITKAPVNVIRRIQRIRPVMRKLLGIDFVHYVLEPVTRKPTESNVSMAVKAAQKALDVAGLSPS